MDLKCEFGLFKEYFSKISSCSITSPAIQIKSINGNHRTGHGNIDVKRIEFLNTGVHFFPRGLNQTFASLTQVNIKNCGLKEICRNDLRGLERLESLYLGLNLLESLPDDLFIGMNYLVHVSVKENKLQSVSSRTFEPVRYQLQTLNLRCNPCINASFNASEQKQGQPGTIDEMMELIKNFKAHNNPLPRTSGASQGASEKPQQQAINFNNFKQLFEKEVMKGMIQLMETQKFWDFTVYCVKTRRKFRVHKIVLAAQSSVFEKKCEKDKDTTIQGFSEKAIELFLRYFYTGEIPEASCAIEVHELAVKYNVHILTLSSEKIIINSINTLDVLQAYQVFAYAHRLSSEQMKNQAFDRICEFFTEKPLTKDLRDSPDRLKKIIDTKSNLELLMNPR